MISRSEIGDVCPSSFEVGQISLWDLRGFCSLNVFILRYIFAVLQAPVLDHLSFDLPPSVSLQSAAMRQDATV